MRVSVHLHSNCADSWLSCAMMRRTASSTTRSVLRCACCWLISCSTSALLIASSSSASSQPLLTHMPAARHALMQMAAVMYTLEVWNFMNASTADSVAVRQQHDIQTAAVTVDKHARTDKHS